MNLPDEFLGGRPLTGTDIGWLPKTTAEPSVETRGARGISDSASLGQPIVAQPKAAPVSSSREEMSKEMGKGAVRREEDGGLGTAVSVGSVGWNVLGLDDPIVGVSDSDKEKK